MKIHISISSDAIHLSSRFPIGSICLFQPNLEKIDALTGVSTDMSSSVQCKILGISFDTAKVLYTIAVVDPQQESGFYEAVPLREVESLLITPLPKGKYVWKETTKRVGKVKITEKRYVLEGKS